MPKDREQLRAVLADEVEENGWAAVLSCLGDVAEERAQAEKERAIAEKERAVAVALFIEAGRVQ